MISKLFKWAVAITCSLPLAAMAEVQMTNPVTGELESYTNAFVGASLEWNSADNWDTGNTPFISGNYDSALVTGKVVSTETAIDGWTLRVGAYNGATVYWSGGITKIQAGTTGCWLTADEDSVIEIRSFAGNQLEGSDTLPLKLSSAKDGGITWVGGITNASNTTLPFWYYLKGYGTVAYGGDITVANAQVIKQADIALSGTSQVASKTLVTFGSGTTKTFSADAAIKVYASDGTTLVETVNLATVNTTGATTLTTSDPVGSVELVQTSTGILLYYVDGIPASYTPSININFCYDSNSGLSTTDDIGYGAYAVPGGSWNNFTVADNSDTQTFGTVGAVNSVGVASTVSGAGVTISGQRGRYRCSSLSAASNLLYGYIDDGTDKTTPTVTITGIPYERYRVIVYAAADTADATFGYMTVNNINYTYANGALTTGTTAWGAAGAADSANELSEGGNVLISAVTSGSTATITGHRASNNCRGNIAAVQIVEYTPTAGDNDLLIELDGDQTYTFSEAKAYDTVYVTGSGTLTFAGEASTASDLDISGSAAVNMDGSTLTPSAVTGNGTAIYTGATPTTGLGWADGSKWQGTLWVKNHTTFSGVVPNTMANANSTLRLSGVVGYFNSTGDTETSDGTLELENDSYSYAFSIDNGWSTSGITVFAKLKGSGLLGVQTRDIAQRYVFKDASEFTGTFNLAGRPLRVILGDGETLSPDEGTITIVSGATATVASGATWTANKNGFRVEGTLNVNGTLASSAETAAVKGSGTVVFTGRAPTPTGDTWWKNAAWTGTVQMKSVTDLVGASSYTGTNFLPVDYGNTGSVLELYNCSGWLPNNSNYQCTVPLKVTGTLTINNGVSGSKFVISSLSGSGTIYTSSNTATTTLQVLEASGFTGKVQLNSKRVVFGNTLPSEYTVGNIYVGEGFSFTVPNSNVAWYGTGGITLAGELKAAALSNFGGGTTITTTDTGVFTLVSDSNTDDMNVDYTRIQGTGTLKYEGTNYRTISTNNFPTALVVENNLSAGLIHRNNGQTVSIGSLSGSGQMRSDWNGSGSTGDRDLRILQAKDTTYSGLFASNNDRIDEVYVAPGASTAGTLTLSGVQTASNGLVVESGAFVNLTGTWVGATTVAGTFGGTGTLTGDLTFSEGATFKVFATDDNGLAVSGTVTCPAEGTVTVDASALEDTGTFALLTASGLDADKFALAEGAPEGATLAVVEGVLTLTVPTPSVTITIPEVENATVAVTVDGVAVTPENGVVTAQVGATVVVTYTADEGYTIANGTIEFAAAADTTTVDTTSVTVTEYIAWIYDENGDLVGNPYTTVLEAVKTFLTTTTGESIRFKTSIEESHSDFHAMLLKACNYNNETFTYTRKPPVAQIVVGQITYQYTSLAEAVEDAANGDTITLLADVTLTDKLVVSNKTVTITADSTKTITGQLRVVDGSNVTIGTNVTITSDTHPTVFVLGDPAVKTAGTAKSTLVVNGTVLNTNAGFDQTFAIAGNGLDTKGVDITINGTVRNANGIAIYQAFPGDLVVNGTVEGASAISIKDGTLTVNSGAVVRATLASGAAYVGNNNGESPTGDAIIAPYYDLSLGYGTPVVSIVGGEITVTDTENCTGIEAYDFEGATAPNDSASNVNVSDGTFNTAVADTYCAEGFEPKDNGDGTYGVRVDKGWIYEDADFPNYTGSWSKDGAALDLAYDSETGKAAIEDGATYTASKPSDGQMVTVAMTLSFDDANDEDEDVGDAKAAVRLASGEIDGTYQFQLYTFDGANKVWTNATVAVAATNEVDYTFVFVLDLTNKTYTASIVDGVTTNVMAVGGATDILFANQGTVTPVQQIEFIGSGSVTSIKGSYEDAPQKFVPGETDIELSDVTTNITLTAAQADWLNACGSLSEVKTALAGISTKAFGEAFLLNLDITDPAYDGTFTFKVTDFTVGDATVSVTVTLTRKGKLDGGINGTLRLTGTADLDTDFADISVTPVGDDDFSGGDTATWTFDKGSVKFFQPVIE